MFLISVGIAFVAGVFLGSYWHLSWFWMAIALLPVGVQFFGKSQRRNLLILAVASIAFFGGIAYYPHSLPTDIVKAPLNNQTPVVLQGNISAPPEIRDQNSHLEISVSSLNGQAASGRVLFFVPRYPEYQYGDVVTVKGILSPVPVFAGFDYQAYLARQGIYATMLSPSIQVQSHRSGFSPLAAIYSFRQALSDSLAAALPEPQAGLAQGALLGIRTTISPQLQNDLAITGTAHLIAISGINLSIIAGMIVVLGLRFFGRRHYYYVWIALAIVWFYTVLAGWQAPVIRSAIMASIFLLAELAGRQKLALPALAASAAIMVGLDPQVLWSVSFQLSFLAMLGLILIAPFFQEKARNFVFKRWGEEGWAARLVLPVTDSFSVSLGSVILIWPIVAYNFGVVSLVGPLTTFLISPALTPIIVLCSLTALIGLVSLPVARVVGWSGWLFLSYMLVMIQAFAALPLIAIQTGSIHLNWVRLYYGLFALGSLIKSNFQKLVGFWTVLTGHLTAALVSATSATASLLARAPRKFVVVPLLAVAVVTSTAAVTLPDSNLHVTFLDVGEGDAVLIQSGGQNILVDGGPSPQALSRGLSSKLPFWKHQIDLLVLTHPHLDHLSGLLETLQRYRVEQVLAPNLVSDNAVYLEWQSLIRTQQIKLTYAARGQQIALNHGTFLEVLNPVYSPEPGDESQFENQGVVLKVAKGQTSFLLTADIDSEQELRLLKDGVDLNTVVLKAAHHGSATSTSAQFLSAVRPQYVVISSGLDNQFGHPSSAVLERLSGLPVWRTDLSGSIEFTTDGQKLWVKTEK